jgi:hypothetical protein
VVTKSCVVHEYPDNKLHSYGIEGNIHKNVHQWLSSFLQNCSMRVVVEGEHSDNAHVDSGAQQATVLGPLLFLCHINDLNAVFRNCINKNFI